MIHHSIYLHRVYNVYMTNERALPAGYNEYMGKLWKRLPDFARRAMDKEPETVGSAEWIENTGHFWWDARSEMSISRQKMASLMNVDINEIRFFEMGLPEKRQLWEFSRSYAEIIGRPELYSTFCDQFNLPAEPARPLSERLLENFKSKIQNLRRKSA